MRFQWATWEELGRDELYAAIVLRQRVFVVEQDCVYQDADGLDPRSIHLLAWGPGRDGDQLLAYLRAFPPDESGAARIGRVVTAPEVRGTGLGRPLMQEGIREVWARYGRCPIRIGAQAHLDRFYGSLGFVVDGDGYDEDGIPHLPMILMS